MPDTPSIGTAWRGHLFLFDQVRRATYAPNQGSKLVLSCVLLEALRMAAFRSTGWQLLIAMALLIPMAFLLVTQFAGVTLTDLGLRRWALWSSSEKTYFAQIVPITLVVFSFFTAADLQKLWSNPQLWSAAIPIAAAQVLWGWYQEFVYRGILQAAFVSRWGAACGILASNLCFTFGPLHFYHFSIAQGHPNHLWIFVAIFSIGLFFAALQHRSGNLWIVGTLHGLGDWFIDGLSEVARLI